MDSQENSVASPADKPEESSGSAAVNTSCPDPIAAATAEGPTEPSCPDPVVGLQDAAALPEEAPNQIS
jgi:hypothetical protein